MVRKIIEDIRPNKGTRKIPSEKEIILPVKLISKQEDYREIREKGDEREEEQEKDIKEEKKESTIEQYFKNKASLKQRLQRTPQAKTKSPVLHKFTLVLFIFVIIAGVIYWGGENFQKADVTITSKHQLITYKGKQFVAIQDSNSDSINFEIMITTDKKLKNVTFSEPKEVSVKAQGSITLYNEYSAKPEKIIAGTFLSDNNGKAYNTDTVVTIPGYKLDNNKKIIPGVASVNITAFLPGDAYNGSPTDFHINAFKETKKYTKIYGKLKSPIEGGASGQVYTMNNLDKNKANLLAQTSFKEDLLREVGALVPPGYILYPNALTFSYKIGDNILSKTTNSEIEMEGTLSVVLLKEKSLMDNIIKISLPNIKGDELKEIKISDLEDLTFNFTNKDQSITKDLTSIPFSLSGDIDAIWNPDIELLKTKLLGVNKNDVLSIFRQDPGIASALVKIFPPWFKYIPNDLSKINILVD